MSKDLFSKQAGAYARFRPTYPPKLFEYLASLVSARQLAWDCATGNGQAALGLAPYFERIVATDFSEKQLAQAKKHPKIAYKLAKADDTPLEDHSVDLVTVAQAAHWFNLDKFYAEVRRVLKPEGVIALWCYSHNRKIEPPLGDIVRRYATEIVGPYWEPEIELVWKEYKTLAFPFKEIVAPLLQVEANWDLAQTIGYLTSWSSTQKFIEMRGTDPVELIAPELKAAWGPAERKIRIVWDIHMRVGR